MQPVLRYHRRQALQMAAARGDSPRWGLFEAERHAFDNATNATRWQGFARAREVRRHSVLRAARLRAYITLQP